jgi:hypothetical protein
MTPYKNASLDEVLMGSDFNSEIWETINENGNVYDERS